ncbi:leucine-rich transmembrane protein, putative [Ixodes scapularis]|uniref:Leucine-rich transmembrane protein, putative n=1 Tax=Ixodes scapularis TaxID=6945 RepID=B7Q161_IXOSC|nr:leucine-rich transmembrane protein, putative [Ixodes scapularis]|eukprot:XP_002408947.1 leucine-rich transmembrane protein, putative [Ixodes scapularis]
MQARANVGRGGEPLSLSARRTSQDGGRDQRPYPETPPAWRDSMAKEARCSGLASTDLLVAALLVLQSCGTPGARAQLAELPALGCRYQQDQQTLLCSNTTLDKMLTSVRIFGSFLNISVRPRSVEIRDSYVPQLPFFLSQFNETLEAFRLVRSRTEHVYPDAFANLDIKLNTLDLSENSLYSVPYAVGTLASVRVLNLSRNSIPVLRPSPVFAKLQQLRVLDLSRNLLGVDLQDVSDPKAVRGSPSLQTRLARNLTLHEFNIEAVADSLEALLLAGNRLAVVPMQLYKRAFPRLQVLDLSENFLTTLPEFAAVLMPRLRNFTAKRNQLESVPFYSIPVVQEHADLTGNPIRCDCQALWLHEWNGQPGPGPPSSSTRANSIPNSSAAPPGAEGAGSVRLPPCASPEGFRGRSLSSITPEALCWHGNQTRAFRYVLKGFEKHALLALTSLDASITVTWSVSDPGEDTTRLSCTSPKAMSTAATGRRSAGSELSPGSHPENSAGLRWTVSYRKESTSPYLMTALPRGGEGTHTSSDEAVLHRRHRRLGTGHRPRRVSPADSSSASITKSQTGSSGEGAYLSPKAAFALGQGYLNANCIQYLDGKKVQVYSHGSKTLPKSCLRSSSRKRRAKANNFFQTRYSPSVKKKERDKTPPPTPRSSTTPRRGTIGRSSQRLSFRTFGKGRHEDGTGKTVKSLLPLPFPASV